MALDTFAKRLASQGRPSPGDISVDDRWAIGGAFKPTITAGGLLVAVAAASIAAFTGTFTPAVLAAYNQADRYHITHRPFPGDQQIENRFAIGGSFLHIATVGSDRAGKLSLQSGASSLAFTGHADTSSGPVSFDPDDRWHLEWRPYPQNLSLAFEDRLAIGGRPLRFTGVLPIGGALSATSGASRAAFVGSASYSIFFDVDYSIAPAFALTDIQSSSGSLTAAATASLAAFRGATLPPNSENGYIAANMSPSSVLFRGTLTPPPSRDGKVHSDSSLATAHLRGTVVPPTGRIGKIAARASASTAHLAGTFLKFQANGVLTLNSADSTTSWFGQALQPGTIYGFVQTTTDPMTAHLKGTTVIGAPGNVIGRRGKGGVRGVRARATIRNTRGKGET